MNTTATMDLPTSSYQDWSQFKNWKKKEGNGSSASIAEVKKESKDLFVSLKGALTARKQEKYILETQRELDRFSEELISWVDSVLLPEKWISEGVHPPTVECKNLAKSAIVKFYKDFSIYPTRISATVEEGIFIKYINHANKKELSIEIYNDLDIAALITKGKEIITSMDIPYISNEYFSKIFEIFYER